MLKFVKFCLWLLMLLHCLSVLVGEDKLVDLNANLTEINDDLWPKNVSQLEEHKSADNEELKANEESSSVKSIDTEAVPNPLTATDTPLESSNRTGRQLYYNPTIYYIQNYATEGSKCVNSRGLVGVCMSFNSCVQAQRQKRQVTLLDVQQWPPHQQVLPYFPPQLQQQEFCTFYDQFARSSYGICCTGIQNVTPVGLAPTDLPQAEEPEMPEEQSSHKPEHVDDSEVLEADLNSFQPEPPQYDNTDNTIDYDPIENLKQAAVYNNYNNYIRYPWPQQFVGFSGVQQWPPPLPTHPPSLDSWPPPLPTHPPNHHYPTHAPVSGGGGGSHYRPTTTTTTRRPYTTTTTRRPSYPSYPTQRPTTSTTTKKPDIGGLGLPLQCGLKSAENPDQERIVGGTNASPHEFPWITVLFKSGKQFCGGSLITNNHILTAAHCVARMTSWDVAALTAHLGDYNIRTDFEVKHITRRIKRLVRHKGFDFSTLHNDVAILTLNEPVQYTKEIQPICLPTSTAQQTRSYSGHIGTVAGWGSLRENGPQPSILQKVQIPIWTNTECAQKYGRAAPAGIIDSMICAGQAAKDSCSGDSGGPLIVNEGGRYIQVGIVSWGIGCGKGQYPGVYTRVTSLLPWIYKNIK
ncbi:serine proteinase stubble [Calliphora vicina]|uniref:serine proteinase stubble n=1 Tax=Calliphora vicina TaxID=7373 RepID=UPI00325A6929